MAFSYKVRELLDTTLIKFLLPIYSPFSILFMLFKIFFGAKYVVCQVTAALLRKCLSEALKNVRFYEFT